MNKKFIFLSTNKQLLNGLQNCSSQPFCIGKMHSSCCESGTCCVYVQQVLATEFSEFTLSKCKYPYLIEVSSLQMLWSIINGFLSFPCFTKPQHFLQSQISAFQCIGIEVACVEESVMNLNQKTVSVSNNVSI